MAKWMDDHLFFALPLSALFNGFSVFDHMRHRFCRRSRVQPLGCSVIQLLNFQAIQVLPVGPVASRSHSFEFNLEL